MTGMTSRSDALGADTLEVGLRRSAHALEAILNAVGESITVQAPDGRLLLANDAALEMLGFDSVPALVAAGPRGVMARFEVLDEEGRPLGLDRLPGRAALRGEETAEMLVRWRRVGSDAVRYSLLKARPVLDDSGQVSFAVNVFRDVTDRQLALDALRASEGRLSFLASASRRLLTTSLDPRRVLAEVADLVVPELADWCVVREFTEDGGLVRVGIGRRPPEDAELLSRLESYGDLLRENSEVVNELVEGRSMLVAEVTPAMIEELARDEEHLDLLRRLGLRSVMLVPLQSRGRTIGVLTLASGSGRAPYDEADLTLVEELAGRVGAAVDNARSYATEHATAATLARALLPGRLPDIPGIQVAGRYRAAGDVGGDFYDCFPTAGGTWMLAVGDVCGRGIHAASMTGLTRHTIRAASLHATSPGAVLADVNQLLLDAAGEGMPAWMSREQGAGPTFCTVCLAAVTPTARGARVVVSSAGHPLPLIVRATGEVAPAGRPGSLLGVIADLDVGEELCHLDPGDALVLFTDGVTERRHEGRQFDEQLASTLREVAGAPAAEVARQVEAAALAFGSAAPGDDMAVLAICIPGDTQTGVTPSGSSLYQAGVSRG